MIKAILTTILLSGGSHYDTSTTVNDSSGLATTGGVMTGATSTDCTGDAINYDNNGVQQCPRATDVAGATARMFLGQDAWSGATTNVTGTSFTTSAGLGRRIIAMTAVNCATDTITVEISGISSVGTEGTSFSCSTTNAACATSVASWINGLSGVLATANSPTSGTVYIQRAVSEPMASSVELSTSDGTCAAITRGTDGAFALRAPSLNLINPLNGGRATLLLSGTAADGEITTASGRDLRLTPGSGGGVLVTATTLQLIDGSGYVRLSQSSGFPILQWTNGSQISEGGSNDLQIRSQSNTTTFYGSGGGVGSISLGGTLTLGSSGVAISRHLSATASLNYGVIAGGACSGLTIAVSNAADGDTVDLGIPNALASTANLVFDGWVSSAGNVTARACCTLLAGSCTDPAAATVRADVWQH